MSKQKEPLEVVAHKTKSTSQKKQKPEMDIASLLDVYEFPVELPGSHEIVTIKPMTTGQLKKVLVYEDEHDPEKIECVLDELVQDCIVDEDFNIDNLYLQDRFFLFLEVRNKTKGESYTFNYKCPKCKNEYVKTLDLSKLEITKKKSDVGEIEVSKNLKVVVDFPKRGEQKQALEYLKSISEDATDNAKLAELSTYTFATAIQKFITPSGVNDEPSLEDRIYLIDNVPRFIFERFTKWFEENNFGVDFRFKLNCTPCEYEKEVEIPLENFFG